MYIWVYTYVWGIYVCVYTHVCGICMTIYICMCYFLVLSRSGPIRCAVQLQRAPVGGGGACAELSSARTAKRLGLPTVCREAAASFS